MSRIPRRTRVASVRIVLLINAFAACGGGEGGPSSPPPVPTPDPSPPDSTVLTRPANPLTMSVTLDRSRAVRAYVTTAGGTITATGADGTRYTLTIPRVGLFEADTITLIPVSATGGKPLGTNGPAAAVQFEPEGLRFIAPATLRIDPARPIPLERQVTLGWHGGGQNTHLEPLDPQARALEMPILHFSGVGAGMIYLGDGIWAPAAEWAEYTPEEFEDRARQYLSELMKQQRERMQKGEETDPTVPDKVREVMRHEWELVIKPILDRATTDCDYASANLHRVLSFQRVTQLAGVGDVAPGLMDGVVAAADNCWNKQKAKCRLADDGVRLREIMSLVRLENLMGHDVSLNDVPICGEHYAGTFEATVLASPEGATMTISGSVLFARDRQEGLTEFFKPVSGTLSWKLSGPYAGTCRVSASGTVSVKPSDGTLEVTHGTNRVTSYTGFGSTGFVENLTITCPDRQYVIPDVGQVRWFNPPRAPVPVLGGAGDQLAGSYRDPTGSWSWTLLLQ